MNHKEFLPPKELENTIKCFWYDRIDVGKEPIAFEVVPDGYIEIIFYFDSTCSIMQNEILQPLSSPFIMGLLNNPVHFFIENTLVIIGIRCYQWVGFTLLGLPPCKGVVPLSEHSVGRIQPALQEYMNTGKIDGAIAIVRQYFLNLKLGITADGTLFKAGAAMARAKGTLPVSLVAQAAHATMRTLERKFMQSSGYTVKDVSGLMRFEQARNRLLLEPNTNLARLAYELGYTDQSHFSREFKRYSGYTPAAFARKSQQDKQT